MPVKPQSASLVFQKVDFDPPNRKSFLESFDSMHGYCSEDKINLERLEGKEQAQDLKLSLSIHDIFDGYKDTADEDDESVDNIFLAVSQHCKEARTSQLQDNCPDDVKSRTNRKQHLPGTSKEQMDMLPKHLQSLLSALCLVEHRH